MTELDKTEVFDNNAGWGNGGTLGGDVLGDSDFTDDGDFITPLEPNRGSLRLKKINKDDTIESMVAKINANFGNIAEHGGGPSGKNGEDGLDGRDGVNVEYIFAGCNEYEMIKGVHYPNDESNLTKLFKDTTQDEESGVLYNETVWYAHAIAVSPEVKNVFVLSRIKGVNSWAYIPPVLWSHWGETGQDGNNIEYIFKTSEEELSESYLESYTFFEDMTEIEEAVFQLDDFYPGNSWFKIPGNKDRAYDAIKKKGILFTINNFNHLWNSRFNGHFNLGWEDEPSGVSSDMPYEYVSIRKSSKNEYGKKIWGDFSQPSLWSSYGLSEKTVFVYLNQPESAGTPTKPSGGVLIDADGERNVLFDEPVGWKTVKEDVSENEVTWRSIGIFKANGTNESWSDPEKITVKDGKSYSRKYARFNNSWGDFDRVGAYDASQNIIFFSAIRKGSAYGTSVGATTTDEPKGADAEHCIEVMTERFGNGNWSKPIIVSKYFSDEEIRSRINAELIGANSDLVEFIYSHSDEQVRHSMGGYATTSYVDENYVNSSAFSEFTSDAEKKFSEINNIAANSSFLKKYYEIPNPDFYLVPKSGAVIPNKNGGSPYRLPPGIKNIEDFYNIDEVKEYVDPDNKGFDNTEVKKNLLSLALDTFEVTYTELAQIKQSVEDGISVTQIINAVKGEDGKDTVSAIFSEANKDGSSIILNADKIKIDANHKLKINAKDLDIKAGDITINNENRLELKSGDIIIRGGNFVLDENGDATFSGDVTAKKFNANREYINKDEIKRITTMDSDTFKIESIVKSKDSGDISKSSIYISILEEIEVDNGNDLSGTIYNVPTLCMSYGGKEYFLYPGMWKSITNERNLSMMWWQICGNMYNIPYSISGSEKFNIGGSNGGEYSIAKYDSANMTKLSNYYIFKYDVSKVEGESEKDNFKKLIKDKLHASGVTGSVYGFDVSISYVSNSDTTDGAGRAPINENNLNTFKNYIKGEHSFFEQIIESQLVTSDYELFTLKNNIINTISDIFTGKCLFYSVGGNDDGKTYNWVVDQRNTSGNYVETLNIGGPIYTFDEYLMYLDPSKQEYINLDSSSVTISKIYKCINVSDGTKNDKAKALIMNVSVGLNWIFSTSNYNYINNFNTEHGPRRMFGNVEFSLYLDNIEEKEGNSLDSYLNNIFTTKTGDKYEFLINAFLENYVCKLKMEYTLYEGEGDTTCFSYSYVPK